MGNICCKKERRKWFNNLKNNLETGYTIGAKCGKLDFDGLTRVATNRSTNEVFHADIYIVESDDVLIQCEIIHKIYGMIDHPNLPRLEAVYRNMKENKPDKVTFIRTQCTGGDLFDRIIQLEAIVEHHTAKYVKQILEAVNHLHKNDIVHRNLKPETISFLDKSHSNIMVHLGLFNTEPGQSENLTQACGTPGYVSPELLNQKYGKETDLWSIGVITYVMLCGYPPFYSDSTTGLYNKIKRGQYNFDSHLWDNVSSLAKDFVNKLLRINLHKRMSCQQALDHSWIKKYAASENESTSDENTLQ
jgi:serine/threonine protein kinase